MAGNPGFSDWISAFRLRTLPLASASILTGAALSFDSHPHAGLVLCSALLTAWLLQILSNLANDLGDSDHGADSAARVGPKRAVQSGKISRAQMKRAVVIAAVLALLSGLLLLWFALGSTGRWVAFWAMLLAGLAAIGAAYRYTAGKKPYGYRGLGDISVFVFFGILGVLGTVFLFRGNLKWADILPAVWAGLQSTSVLNLNNLRDVRGDGEAGKRTLVVRMGFKRGKIYHNLLILIPLAAVVSYSILLESTSTIIIALFWALFAIVHLRYVKVCSDPAKLDPELKKVALSTFISAVLFFILEQII